jgi:ligand-binding sensor domain-containing protein
LSRRTALALAIGVCLLMPVSLRAERLPIKTYSFAEGLAHMRVKRIVQDSHGFLWFCTFEGLSRFDGSQFTNYGAEQGLPFPSLNDVMEMPDGTYWIASNGGGMIRFRPNTVVQPATDATLKSRFTSYDVGQEGATNRVNVVFRTRSGAVWLGTDGGLFQLEETGSGPVFRPFPLNVRGHPDLTMQIWSMTEDHDGSVWMGTKFGVLRRLPDGSLVHHPVRPGPSSDNVYFAQFDDAGTLWLAHESGPGGVHACDGRRPVGHGCRRCSDWPRAGHAAIVHGADLDRE